MESRDGFLVRSCTFWTGGDRYLLVQVNRGVAASRDQFELSRLPGDRAVAGIGQAARWTRDTGLLDVLDGPARFQVGLFTTAAGPARRATARLEAAARAVAARSIPGGSSPGQAVDPGDEMPNLLQGGRGRPLHPMLVHFPVALYPTSLVFDALSHLSDDGNPFVVGAFSLIVIALVVSALAMAAGFADFLPIENGTRTWRVAVLHMSVQLVTSGLFLANAVLRGRDLDVTATPTGPIVLSVIGLLTLTLGSALGGELVYRHGRRVELDLVASEELPPADQPEPPPATSDPG